MNKWTKQDETKFQQLAKLRDEWMAEKRRPVFAIAEEIEHSVPNEASDIADYLIRNCDDIRDALEPFDSGVRAALPEITTEPPLMPKVKPAKSSCQQELMAAGEPYPRTCTICILGPCRRKASDSSSNAKEQK